jgi:hypothetical protein
MTFEYTSFSVMGQGDMKLIVYTPLDQDGTSGKLDALLATRKLSRTRSQSKHSFAK